MSTPPTELPPPAIIADIANRFWDSQFLFVAARLGVADVLAEGPRSAEEIGRACEADAHIVTRILRALAPLGVFREVEEGRFEQTALSDLMRSTHPKSLRDPILFWVDDWTWRVAGHLVDGARTGRSPFETLFGGRYFEKLAEEPDREALFARAMSGMAFTQIEAVADAYPFAELGSVVDVGGGSGHLLAAILHTDPALKGILFDLASVVDRAKAEPYLSDPAIAPRVTYEAGSALASVPAGAGCYVIKQVLHDWDDEHCVTMLRNIATAMSAAGRLVIVEAVIKPDNRPDFYKRLDLTIWSCNAGHERTEAEFAALLDCAGLVLSQVISTAAGVSLIEARLAA